MQNMGLNLSKVVEIWPKYASDTKLAILSKNSYFHSFVLNFGLLGAQLVIFPPFVSQNQTYHWFLYALRFEMSKIWPKKPQIA